MVSNMKNIKKFCDSFLEMGLPGFDLAVYKDGNCILRHMNGYSDIENKIEIKGTEKYNIYSCSKVITCVAALMLYEKGLFDLEDELCRYMPEFTEMTVKTEHGIQRAKNPILIKHLFEMTAGFSYDLCSPELLRCRKETDGRCPTRDTMKYLAKEPLLFEPGDRWEYSLCHDVLAALVEVLSEMKYETFVKKHIFDVLDMNDTTFMLPEDEIDTICPQYRFEEGQAVSIGKHISYKLGSEYASGGAGGISTVDDYMKFLEGLRTYKLLKPQTLELMITDRLSKHQKRTYWTQNTHGYGLGVRCSKGNKKHIDFGWGGAACAHLAIDMENGISLYFGAHMLSSPTQGLLTMLYRFVRAELAHDNEFQDLYHETKELHGYNLTY